MQNTGHPFEALTLTGYRPMNLTQLGGRVARTADAKVRSKLVWEFLEEYRWEQAEAQPSLLQDEPPPVATSGGMRRCWRRWRRILPHGSTSLPAMG